MANTEKVGLCEGDILRGNGVSYSLVRLLGEDAFGVMVECVNLTTNEAVAVRIIQDQAASSDATREVNMLQRIAELSDGRCNMVRFKDSFTFEGTVCLVFEKLDISLSTLLNTETSSMRLPEVRSIAQQLLKTFGALKDLSLIHSDLKLENVMLTDRRTDGLKVKLVDFGLACPVADVQQGTKVQPDGYRAPEVAMGCEYACPIDMWGLGCTLAFTFLGRNLLPHNDYQSMKMTIDLLGVPPDHMIQSGIFSGRYFKKDTADEDDPLFPKFRFLTPEEFSSVTHQSPGKPSNLQNRLKSLDDLVKIYQTVNWEHNEDLRAFVHFLKGLLTVNPKLRLTPEQALKHPFLTMSHLSAGSPYAKLSKSAMDQVMDGQQEVLQKDQGAAPPEEAQGVPAGAEDPLPQVEEAESSSSSEPHVPGRSPLIPPPPQPEEVHPKHPCQGLDKEERERRSSEGEVCSDDSEAGADSSEELRLWLKEFKRPVGDKGDQLRQKNPEVQERIDRLIKQRRDGLFKQRDGSIAIKSLEEKFSVHDSGVCSRAATPAQSSEKEQTEPKKGKRSPEGKTEETPKPSVNVWKNEEETPKPSVNVRKNEEETPKPSVNVWKNEEETPKPSVNVRKNEEETPKPSVNVWKNEEETPKPSVNVWKNEEETPKPSVNVWKNEEETPKPSVNVQKNEEETPKPSVNVWKNEEETPKPMEKTEGQCLLGNKATYRVVRFLGEGAFGRVLEGRNLQTKEAVAIKMIKDPKAIREARHEIRMMAKIAKLDADRCNVVQFKECFSHSGLTCMVFEKLDISLWDYLRDYGALFLRELRPVAQQLLVAFNALKDISIVHTDLKPDNVMFVDMKQQPLRVKLIDFGLVCPTAWMRPGMDVQPFGLRAPEVLLGCRPGYPIDLWALGCTLFYVLFREWLFRSCCYQTMKMVVNLCGMPPEHMLRSGLFTDHYFIKQDHDQHGLKWRLRTPEEYHQATLKEPARAHADQVSSFDDIFRLYRVRHPEEQKDLKMFVDFLKGLLSVDPELRLTAEQALKHPFITMSHLSTDTV